jgi:hypothetical protein
MKALNQCLYTKLQRNASASAEFQNVRFLDGALHQYGISHLNFLDFVTSDTDTELFQMTGIFEFRNLGLH